MAGCGVCHTDLGFFDGSVATIRRLPLVLGHEVAGTVVEAGVDGASWIGRRVLVAAVIPCGTCDLCRRPGEGQYSPDDALGNAIDGGFASHLTVPAGHLTRSLNRRMASSRADFAVVADVVTTPLQAVRRRGRRRGSGDRGRYRRDRKLVRSKSRPPPERRSSRWILDPARLEPLKGGGAGSDRSRRALGARGQRPGADLPPPMEPPTRLEDLPSAPGTPPARRPPLRCW